MYIYIYTRACIVRIRVQNSTSCAALSSIEGSSNSLFLMSDLDIASLHLFPTCPGAVLTKACSEKGIGFHRGCCWPCFWSWPRAPVLRFRRQNRRMSVGDDSGLVFWNLAPSSQLRCLSIRSSFANVSGLVFKPGSEGSFAMPVEKIKLRRCFWSRF